MKGGPIAKALALFGVLGGLALLLLVPKLFLGKEIGETCDGGIECRGIPVRCLETEDRSYCTRPCESLADCPSDWRCESATWFYRSGEPRNDELVCVVP